MNRIMLAAALAALSTAPLAGANAMPAYVQKEGKACGYCHVKPDGTGGLGPAGQYYKAHNFSLVGYTEAGAGAASTPAKTGPPSFKALWKMDLADGVTRVASAVLTADNKPRLLVLGADNKLKISDVTGASPVDDATIDLGALGAHFVVGHFAAGKPSIIAAPGAIWYRDGDKYASKKVPKLTDIAGSLAFCDKTESIFQVEGTDMRSWAVDLSADGDAALKPGTKAVTPDEGAGVYSNVLLRPGEDLLEYLGIPEPARKAGVIGLIDPRGDKKLYVWAPVITDKGSSVVVVNEDAFSDPTAVKPLWQTPKSPAKVLDVFYGPDPKGGKEPGLLVLTATGAEGNGRTLEFYALD